MVIFISITVRDFTKKSVIGFSAIAIDFLGTISQKNGCIRCQNLINTKLDVNICCHKRASSKIKLDGSFNSWRYIATEKPMFNYCYDLNYNSNSQKT